MLGEHEVAGSSPAGLTMGMQQWIVVLTTPGRGSYREATLASLDEAGGSGFEGRKIVYCDGTDVPFDVPSGWEAVPSGSEALSGTTAATFGALAFVREHGAGDVLFFEDDVVSCRNAVTFMSKVTVPDRHAFLVFSDIRGFSDLRAQLITKPGDGGDGRGHWGNQALKIPRRTLMYLRHAKLFDAGKKSASDLVLGYTTAGLLSPWASYGVCSPSIFDHVGYDSAALPGVPFAGEGRATRNFAGRDFDAMTLLPLFQRE